MIRYILLFAFVLNSLLGFSKEGKNNDPYETKIGCIPNEMKNRQDEYTPIATFEDCTKWTVEGINVEVALYRTRQERVFSEYSGRIHYKATADNATFRIQLKKPVEVKDWDCLELWNYGDHWCWETNASTAMRVFVIIRDANGLEHVMPIVQAGYDGLVHKYWFLSHFKLIEKLEGPTQFVGYKFVSDKPDIGVKHSIFLGNTYIFKEKYPPFQFKELPDKLPFPLRKETIAPTCKRTDGVKKIEKTNNTYSFMYQDSVFNLLYNVDTSNPFASIRIHCQGDSRLLNNNASIVFENHTPVKWVLMSEYLRNDTLTINYKAVGGNINQQFLCRYWMQAKSLVWTIEEKGSVGKVSEINLGTTEVVGDAKLIPVPFLVYNYSYQRPNILYNDGLFYFTMFDWYYTNSSAFFAGTNTVEKGNASYNGGARYIPLINGKRNLLRERLYINVSDDVQEVLPTIDNPSSPMRSMQADRLWCIKGGDNLDVLKDYVSSLRSRGVEKVSMRNHEEFWRKGGESFTFKLEPNEGIGVDKLRDYVRFVKSQDWRIGFYSNYTDFSPVSARWNRDWIKQGPQGEWEVAWARTYSPKPHVAWEQQAYFAPKIQKMFGTNHSYCDVHTAVSPMSRVDFDFRSPGAGMFRSVINYYGLLLMNERRAYLGPVYSEGGNHFWYAGLLDGNYANGDLNSLPIFPDFQLLKINPLQMDAANTGAGYEYLAYALAYGNIGILTESLAESIKRYAMLQPLQNSYAMMEVENILYSDGERFYNTSEAIKRDLLDNARLLLEYKSGLKAYVNFSTENWKISEEQCVLPQFGFYAVSADRKLKSYSILDESLSNRIDKVYSPDIYYLNSPDQIVGGELAGKGAYMVKKEKFSWEIIPVGEDQYIEFDLSLLGMGEYGVDIQATDMLGNPIQRVNESPVMHRVSFTPLKGHYKYRIIPVR